MIAHLLNLKRLIVRYKQSYWPFLLEYILSKDLNDEAWEHVPLKICGIAFLLTLMSMNLLDVDSILWAHTYIMESIIPR